MGLDGFLGLTLGFSRRPRVPAAGFVPVRPLAQPSSPLRCAPPRLRQRQAGRCRRSACGMLPAGRLLLDVQGGGCGDGGVCVVGAAGQRRRCVQRRDISAGRAAGWLGRAAITRWVHAWWRNRSRRLGYPLDVSPES